MINLLNPHLQDISLFLFCINFLALFNKLCKINLFFSISKNKKVFMHAQIKYKEIIIFLRNLSFKLMNYD